MAKASLLKRFVRLHPDSRELRRLRMLQEEYLGDLDEQELEAIKKHLSGPYEDIEYGPSSTYGTKELGEELDAIIAGAPRLDEPITTYRGTTGEGLIPENKYPLTTTIDPVHAGSYAEGHAYTPEEPSMLTEIEVPERSPGLALPDDDLYFKLTGELPPFGDEFELLLPTSDLELIRKYQPETVYQRADVPSEKELKMMIELRRYIKPYKARGGLVHGYT